MKKAISIIPEVIDRNDAFKIVQSVSGEFSPQIQKRIFYPYHWVHFEYTVKTFLGKRTIQAYCLVDLLENQAATSDRFSVIEEEIEEENILVGDTDRETALKTAETYLVHSAIHQMKALLYPKSSIIKEIPIHKPFWVVRCENKKGERFKAIVDGITGKFQVLSSED